VSDFEIPLLVRGELIEEDWEQFSARDGSTFRAVDVSRHVDLLPLSSPMALSDLYDISFGEILDVLAELGKNLAFDTNPHLREAYEAGLVAANYPASMLKNSYLMLPAVFERDYIHEIAEERIGIDYLEGWVGKTLNDGRELKIRAFGARSLHIPAGNGGVVSAITIIRNAITRSDAIIKAPSNDPLTAMAIARTLAEVAPGHPLTKHLSVGYWKGGDTAIEEKLYRPENIEKMIAWGGFASVKHITRYIQPGLELIALDPKNSATIIGPEAFDSEDILLEVATRAACDIGMANQEACASARVIYVLCGTDEKGIERVNRLGELIYQQLLALPEHISTKPKTFNRELRDHLEASRLDSFFCKVIGGENNEGAVVVSQFDEAVDYAPLLSGRVANLVPVDSIDRVTGAVTAYTQTVGVYPDSLKQELRDTLPLFGAQRLTSLGYACNVTSAKPQDAMEPLRRMCKWIVDETCEPDKVFPLWRS
jgi:hypothetical protein